MSLDENRILVECDCGLIFRLLENEIPEDERFCDLVPEKDLGQRKKQCIERKKGKRGRKASGHD